MNPCNSMLASLVIEVWLSRIQDGMNLIIIIIITKLGIVLKFEN